MLHIAAFSPYWFSVSCLYFYTMVCSTRERVKAIELYLREGSAVRAQHALRRELGLRRAPSFCEIKHRVAQFEASGSVVPVSYPRPRRELPQTLLQKVMKAMHRNPRLSVRNISRQLLRLHPYKFQLAQQLRHGDMGRRRRLCSWLRDKWRSRQFRKFLVMSEEAYFHLNGTVNKHNCRVGAAENPHPTTKRAPLEGPCVTAWCGICSRGILGPHFFERAGRRVSVTGGSLS